MCVNNVSVHPCMYLCMYLIYLFICMYMCMYLSVHMYVCLYVFMYLSSYARVSRGPRHEFWPGGARLIIFRGAAPVGSKGETPVNQGSGGGAPVVRGRSPRHFLGFLGNFAEGRGAEWQFLPLKMSPQIPGGGGANAPAPYPPPDVGPAGIYD